MNPAIVIIQATAIDPNSYGYVIIINIGIWEEFDVWQIFLSVTNIGREAVTV